MDPFSLYCQYDHIIAQQTLPWGSWNFSTLVDSHGPVLNRIREDAFYRKTFPLYDLYGHILVQEPLFRGS